jgi:hypothetical protein
MLGTTAANGIGSIILDRQLGGIHEARLVLGNVIPCELSAVAADGDRDGLVSLGAWT